MASWGDFLNKKYFNGLHLTITDNGLFDSVNSMIDLYKQAAMAEIDSNEIASAFGAFEESRNDINLYSWLIEKCYRYKRKRFSCYVSWE